MPLLRFRRCNIQDIQGIQGNIQGNIQGIQDQAK